MPPSVDPATELDDAAAGGGGPGVEAPPAAAPAGAAPPEPPARRRPAPPALVELAALAALGAFVAAFFWPLLDGHVFSTVGNLQNGVFPWAAQPNGLPVAIQDDSATLSHGWQAYATSALRAGAFPFWGADGFGGYALFANGSSGFANPLRIGLALTVKPFVAHELFSLFHLAAGGALAYLLARDLRVGRWGALLVGTAWMLSSWNLGWLHLEVVSPIILFFPAGLLLVRRAVQRHAFGWTALAAAVLAWSLVSAHLLFALVNWLVCLAYGAVLVAWPLVSPGGRARRALAGRAARLAAAAALSLGLAAPVLLPTWLMLGGSQREPMTYAALEESGLSDLGTFLHTFSPPDLPLDVDGFNADLVFAGTATALLALVGVFARRPPAAALGRGLAAGLFLVAVGTPLTWVVFTFVPGMDVFRPYTRLAMWWCLAVGLLGGVGLDVVVAQARRWRRWAGPALAVAVIGVTAAQLLDYGRALNPPFPRRDAAYLFPATPLVQAMQAESTSTTGWPVRHAGVRGPQDAGWTPPMLFANTNLAVGLDSATGYDSAFPERSTDAVRVLAGEDPEAVLASGLRSAYAPVLDVGRARLELLGRMGVSQAALVPGLVLEDGWAAPLRAAGAEERYRGPDGTLVRLDDAGPRLVGGTTTVADRRQALLAFTDPAFDHTASVLLEGDELDRLGEGRPLPDAAGPAGQVLEARRGVNTARLVVEAERPAWLLVPDGWDPGWSATVGGDAVPVLRADYYQRAVLVPAGRSEVELRFRPEGWSAGLALGLVSALLCATGTAAPWRRRRRRGRPAGAPVPGRTGTGRRTASAAP